MGNTEIKNQGLNYMCTRHEGNELEFVHQPYPVDPQELEDLFETEEEWLAACEADADAVGIPFIFEASIGCQCLDHLKVGDMCQVTFVDDEHVYVTKL